MLEQDTQPTTPRTAKIFIAGWAILLMVVLTAGALSPDPALTWGFHFLRFLPWGESVLLFVLIILSAGYLSLPSAWSSLQRLGGFYGRNTWIVTAILIAVFVAAAWLLRIVVPLLGDSFFIVNHYAKANRGDIALAARNEPLAVFFFYSLMKALGNPGYDTLRDAFFLGEILLGGGIIIAATFLVRQLFTNELHRILALLFLLTMPYMQLLFGYVENYSLTLFVVVVYALLAVLVLRGKLSIIVLSLYIVVQLLTHYLTLLLLPSFVYVVWQAWRQGKGKEVVAGIGLLGIAVLVLLAGAGWDFTVIYPPSMSTHTLTLETPIEFSASASQAYTLFSRYHFLDLANYFLLMAFSIVIVLLASLIDRGRYSLAGEERVSGTFFAIGFLPVILFLGIVKFDLGAARDWDVCAPYFIVGALAALVFALPRERSAPLRSRIVAFAAVLAALISLAMMRVNSLPGASIERYNALFDRRVMSRMAWYNGHMNLARYYRYTSEPSSAAAVWTRYSNEFPDDIRGYQNILSNLATVPNARETQIDSVYTRWFDARPHDKSSHVAYARFLIESGNRHFQANRLGEALDRYNRAFRIDSLNVVVISNIGSVLAEQGKPQEAIPWFLSAVRLQPDFADAYYNLANAYTDCGEKAKGREYYRIAAGLGNSAAAEMLD